MNVVRAISEEGFGRVAYNKKILQQLNTDKKFRDYFEQETTELPQFYLNLMKEELGPLWEWLPEGAIFHDQNAYLNSVEERIAV
jgi:hypothetical protein